MVDVTNLIMGPGTLYSAPFGTTEPTDTDIANTPVSPWRDVGGTMGGVQLAINQEYTELAVDQVVDIPGRRLTKRELQLVTQMAEPTLENLALATNNSSQVVTGTGVKSFEPTNDNSATQPEYTAVLFDGFAAGSFRRRVIGRRILSVANTEFAYTKDGQTVYTVTLSCHYVSPGVRPFRIVDESPA